MGERHESHACECCIRTDQAATHVSEGTNEFIVLRRRSPVVPVAILPTCLYQAVP